MEPTSNHVFVPSIRKECDDSDHSSILPDELIVTIFSNLTAQELGRCAVANKRWSIIAKEESLKEKALMNLEDKGFTFIGGDIWKSFQGDVGEVPPLPENILEILYSPCPWFKGKKVFETHMLVLIPKAVNGTPLTLNIIEELFKQPDKGLTIVYSFFIDALKEKYGDMVIDNTHWVLMTKELLEGSKGNTRKEQFDLVASQNDYQVPKLIEAVLCLLMSYLSKNEMPFRLTYTCCQEPAGPTVQTIVCGSPLQGLEIDDCHVGDCVGVAALRSFTVE